jgi:putative multiple sugar transport system permease protein
MASIPDTQGTASAGGHLKANFREYGMLLALVVIMAFFQYMTNGVLLRPLNLTNLFLQNSYIIIMALGMLLVIVSGHIDLSVGSVAGFIGGLAGVLIVRNGFPVVPTILLCIMMGAAIGAAQGYWIAFWRIPSFIVTLAGMLVFRGLNLAMLKGESVGPFPKSFQLLSSGFVPDILGGAGGLNLTALVLGCGAAAALVWGAVRARAKAVRYAAVEEPFSFFLLKNGVIAFAIVYITYLLATARGLPNVLITMAVLIAAYTFVTKKTTIGRRIYALGGNEKAAKLSGIKTGRLVFLVFTNMGMLAALAGLIIAARLNSATPSAGVSFELDVIAACFIGGASASGGVGRIVGAVIGAFIMGVMNNGMSIMGVGIDFQQVIKGLVLLAAVIFDVYNKNKA